MIETNKLYLGNCIDVMATFPNECIDLTERRRHTTICAPITIPANGTLTFSKR